MLTIDTNILIYYLGGEKAVVEQVDLWRKEFGFLITSTIVQIELLSYPDLRPREVRIIAELLATMHVVAVDDAVASLAAAVRRSYRLKLADAIVAATALHTGTSLVTRNMRDFQVIDELVCL